MKNLHNKLNNELLLVTLSTSEFVSANFRLSDIIGETKFCYQQIISKDFYVFQKHFPPRD